MGENNMTAEIISVGTELLLGNIVNTNAAYLAEQCAMLGLSVYYQSVVGDNAMAGRYNPPGHGPFRHRVPGRRPGAHRG